MPGEVSSTSVRIGRLPLVTRVSPVLGFTLLRRERLCSIDMCSRMAERLKAQVSSTCCPKVLITFIFCLPSTRRALPCRAGIVTRSPIRKLAMLPPLCAGKGKDGVRWSIFRDLDHQRVHFSIEQHLPAPMLARQRSPGRHLVAACCSA